MNIVHKSFAVLGLLICMASCKRDHKEGSVIGPANIAASSKFAIVSPDTFRIITVTDPITDVYLSTASPNFGAKFNETVSWKIILTGLNSTAVKTLSGTSSVIDASNSVWTGNHDGLYYFEDNETIKADLIIAGREGIYSTTNFLLAQSRTFQRTATFSLSQTASNTPTTFEGILNFPTLFNVGGTTTIKLQDSIIRAPEGTHYVHIEGVSTQANGFFVGGLQCRMDPSADTSVPRFMPKEWTDPNKIYLNIYIRGIDHLPVGTMPYAELNFECHEDDNLNPSTVQNCTYYAISPVGTGTDWFCPSSEDAWVSVIPITHVGWKLFSIRYSDLLPSADLNNGGHGNKKQEPQKVCRVQFGLVSSPPFNHVQADIDFACFTYGAPLDPTK